MLLIGKLGRVTGEPNADEVSTVIVWPGGIVNVMLPTATVTGSLPGFVKVTLLLLGLLGRCKQHDLVRKLRRHHGKLDYVDDADEFSINAFGYRPLDGD